MTLTNNKSKGSDYFLAGARFGGNVGIRFNFGLLGLTPRIGLTVPVFFIFDSFDFDDDSNAKFYALNALMRVLEIGLTVDLGATE